MTIIARIPDALEILRIVVDRSSSAERVVAEDARMAEVPAPTMRTPRP